MRIDKTTLLKLELLGSNWQHSSSCDNCLMDKTKVTEYNSEICRLCTKLYLNRMANKDKEVLKGL
jgi:hypothetical protein